MRVLMYHQITAGPPPNVHAVSAAEFARQLRWLRDAGYASAPLEGGPANANDKAIALTFDDGYRDFRETALPLLREHGFTATVFLIAGLMGQCRAWPDGADASCPPFLTWAEAREIGGATVRFGSHTLTHPDLAALPLPEAERELRDSRRRIEDEIGQPVLALSYPFGRHTPAVRQLAAECGYKVACAGPVGYVGAAGRDPFQLNRVTALATDSLDAYAQKVQGSLRRRAAWLARRVRARLRQTLGHT